MAKNGKDEKRKDAGHVAKAAPEAQVTEDRVIVKFAGGQIGVHFELVDPAAPVGRQFELMEIAIPVLISQVVDIRKHNGLSVPPEMESYLQKNERARGLTRT